MNPSRLASPSFALLRPRAVRPAGGVVALRLALVIGPLLCLHPAVSGASQATNDAHVIEDKAACKASLNRIFEAIQEYQKTYAKLPNVLSDLHPEFIADPRRFICPAVLRKGDFSSWRSGVRPDVFQDVLPTSYTYEFCLKEYPLWAGKSSTEREFKLRAMKLIGSDVPIVRCLAHRPVFNLSYGGSIFESGWEWEYHFTNRVRLDQLLPPELFKDLAPVPGRSTVATPERDPAAGPHLIDLSGHYVSALHTPWMWRNPRGHDLSALPQGVVKLDDAPVAFDVRGVIQLNSTNLFAPFPARVDSMAVGQTCRRLHFLQGAIYRDPPGTEIGRYEVRYADGRRIQIPIVYGRDSWAWSHVPEDSAGGPRLVWRSETTQGGLTGRQHRLYHQEWSNPRPGVAITSIDFVSAMTGAAPFLIGVTLDP